MKISLLETKSRKFKAGAQKCGYAAAEPFCIKIYALQL